MSFKTASVVLAAAVATSGTITVSYPAGTNKGTYTGAYKHKAFAEGLQANLSAPTDFTVSFGASNITVTYLGTTSIPANSKIMFQFDVIGKDRPYTYSSDPVNNQSKLAPNTQRMSGLMYIREINLGSPIAGAANNICTSQAITAASPTGGTLNGTTAGVADVPRNVVAAWTNSAVITVRGTDEYGNAMTESSASGTSFTGKKAFATVTSVKVSADVTGATVGFGNVLGLPIALPEANLIVKELQDGAAPTAGTTVAQDQATATATTGDVRGTYTPNATPDASKSFQLLVAVPDLNDIGNAQFAG
ncbi:hypothetical protein [Bradyrhizobium stylosanthis]|uniref:Uncharacterized protein n=1 Tax=Bradyrhizobium stylosanthis TaxID=1803665 RepID=A0A560CXJ6_9BRAD|nr:hypothetical protein [Bradyrhizobium stylosanthis]TWA89579.1 hypothetical protein FBZ96_11947 [Bradyrhizobium stylosanthis]